MSIRDKRVRRELDRYPMLRAPAEPWGEVLALSVPAHNLRIDLTLNYPFAQPTFYVNGENVLTRLKTQYMAVRPKVLAYGFDFPCICCRIVISSTRWAPSEKIETAIDDYCEWAAHLAELEGYFGVKETLPFDELVHRNVLKYLIIKPT